jgi:hypothetical protein
VFVNSVRNVTRDQNYSLAGVTIIGDGDTVLLAKNAANMAIGMATFDVVEVDYRYRSSNTLLLSQQPVQSIVSVTASDGTVVDPSKYTLYKIEDPLANGNSTIAQDSVKFLFTESDGIPEFISITAEEHDLLLNTSAKLNMKGVDVTTLVVQDPTLATTYVQDVDYSVQVGSDADYTYLVLLPNGMIRQGGRVVVSYQASENFDVVYITNGLLSEVQNKLNVMKHACADTVSKGGIQNFVDTSFMVTRKAGTDVSLLRSRVQTAVSNYVATLKMGDTFTQGALVNVVQGVTGVKEIILPLTKMMKRNGSFICMDDLGYLSYEIYQKSSGGGIISYRTVNPVLTYSTSEGGGDANLFRAVYENNMALTTVASASDVVSAKGQAYIQADGRIIISSRDGTPPHVKYYKASYYTFYPAGQNVVSDIPTSELEYLTIDTQSMRDMEIVEEKVPRRGF